MSNILEDSITYLAGPIDCAKDQGTGYRNEIKNKLKKLRIRCLDPCKKMAGLQEEVGEEQNKIIKYKKAKEFISLQRMMKQIVREDLRMIDYSDFIIAYVDPQVLMCGTVHEIVLSLSQKKPTLVIVKGGLKNAPSWLFGICNLDHMFNDIDGMVKYLDAINDGDKEPESEWVLIRKQLKQYETDK
jgi:nucleoside 2-deoxyribosyltransferase